MDLLSKLPYNVNSFGIVISQGQSLSQGLSVFKERLAPRGTPESEKELIDSVPPRVDMQSSHELKQLPDAASVSQPTPVIETIDRFQTFSPGGVQRAVSTWSDTQSNSLETYHHKMALQQLGLVNAQASSFNGRTTKFQESPVAVQALPNAPDDSFKTLHNQVVLPQAAIQAKNPNTPGDSSNMPHRHIILPQTTFHAQTASLNQAFTHNSSDRITKSADSDMTEPMWLNPQGNSLKARNNANTKQTSRLGETSATNRRDAPRDLKRQRQSDTLIQAPAKAPSLTPAISTYLGQRFRGSDLLIKRFHDETYSMITTINLATSWASTRLKERPRNLFEDVYAVLILCHFHSHDPDEHDFDVRIEMNIELKTTSPLQALRVLRMALTVNIFYNDIKSRPQKIVKTRLSLRPILCINICYSYILLL